MKIVGMRMLDVGLCSYRCKLKEVVCPFGKCVDRVYKGCENDELNIYCICDAPLGCCSFVYCKKIANFVKNI